MPPKSEFKYIMVSLPSQHRKFKFETMKAATDWLTSIERLDRHMKKVDKYPLPKRIAMKKSFTGLFQQFTSKHGDDLLPLAMKKWLRRKEREYVLATPDEKKEDDKAKREKEMKDIEDDWFKNFPLRPIR